MRKPARGSLEAIEEIVSDPMVRAMMEADGVDPDEFAALLLSVAAMRSRWSVEAGFRPPSRAGAAGETGPRR